MTTTPEPAGTPGPAAMLPLTPFDLHLLGEGTHHRAHEKLGAHLDAVDGVSGTRFRVWAPNAREVSVIGGFNQWDNQADPMVRIESTGIWERFVPGAAAGDRYKYALKGGPEDRILEKSDPYGFAAELRPRTSSKVWDHSIYQWSDSSWMASRADRQGSRAPIAIYEVHLGSWMRRDAEGNRWLSYRELAEKLADHATEMGFTHVEFLPVAEHPFDGSWGYQAVGYFAPTSRFGSPDDFKYLIDRLHQRGLGVILDWVPAHFSRDEHGLAGFDGTALYEHADPRRGLHREWGTAVFDHGSPGVRNFLISNALFWLDQYHVDGLRVDAVASMLYHDYAREPGEWIPNTYGGRENLEAITLLRTLNHWVHAEYPGVLMFAEESTAWPMVSRPTEIGGLGFDYKWDLGWMHDTLDYLAIEPARRKDHHNRLTFRMLYAFNENYLLPLSHDEVVHLKGSLIQKMPGDSWRKFANARLLLGSLYTQPGKKLLFMGDEFGAEREWDHDASLDWSLLERPLHAGLKRWTRDLNTVYRAEPALHELDGHPDGFQWIDCDNAELSVVCFLRRGRSTRAPILIVCNYTATPRENYRVGVPEAGRWIEILNGDATIYGGSGQGNLGGLSTTPIASHGFPRSLNMTLPPLALLAFRQAR